jgi:hypothetical protein
MMRLALEHPANRGILTAPSGSHCAFFDEPGDLPDFKTLDQIENVAAVYQFAGHHPEIVARVWDQLGGSLPVEGRCLVRWTPALVEPESGVVLAVCYGTEYALRVPDEFLPDALAAGCNHSFDWGRTTDRPTDRPTDLRKDFGAGWVFGGFVREEPDWCRAAFEKYRLHAGHDA